MKRWASLLLLVLIACAPSPPKLKPDYLEAARINTQLGADYMRRGNFDMAREKLERAVDQDPNYAPAYSALALLYQRRGDAKAAESHFRRAMTLEPGNPEVSNNFGVFLCSRGKYKEANKYFTEAAANPRYSTPEAAWTNSGLCAKSYDMEKAEHDFREALRIRPDFPEALSQMAGVSWRNKNALQARAFLQRYEAASKPNAEALWVGVQVERDLGDELAARKYEARLKRDFPESPQAAGLVKTITP